MSSTRALVPGVERLRDWMDRSKLNQTETAELLGFHPVVLSQILNGHRRPGLENALTIEHRTGISIEHWTLTGISGKTQAESETGSKRRLNRA